MKSMHVTVSIIAAAAVLLAAYAVGLLIRHARMSGRMPKNVADINQPDRLPKRTTQPTVEERAKIKAARADEIKRGRNRTEDEKEQFKEQVSGRLSGAGPNRPADANRAAEQGRRNLPRMQVRMRGEAAPQPTPADANNGAPAGTRGTRPQDAGGNASGQDANNPS